MTLFETIRLILGFDNWAVVRNSIEQSDGHFGIAKYSYPLTEIQVSGNDKTGFFIQFANQMK